MATEKLFDFLLFKVQGDDFETLAKRLFAIDYDEEFEPLGGMHDGGADGVLLSRVCGSKKPNTFYQFSVTEEDGTKRKVLDTIAALRKAGRDPRQLIYATTSRLPKHDVLQEEVFESEGVLLRVRDAEHLYGMVSRNKAVSEAFNQHFAGEITGVMQEAAKLRGPVNKFVADPTVFAFLDFELRDRFARDVTHDKILDALIYWALRGTDPDAGKWLTRGQIAAAIVDVFPNARNQLLPRLDMRLALLSSKKIGDDRVRFHKKDDIYCLPFDMRTRLAARAMDEVGIQEGFIGSIRERLSGDKKDWMNEDLLSVAVNLVFQTVHEYFVEQGVILAAFLEKKIDKWSVSEQVVEDQIGRAIARSEVKAKISPMLIQECMNALRGIFYRTNELERGYLQYLSRTSMLFTTLQAAPRLIEYFNQMGGNFRLLVGNDLLVKAISEQYLEQKHRQVETLLKITSQMGARLVLTEAVLVELFTHLHAVDREYCNHFLPNEAYMTQEQVSECNRILIRAYYHGRNMNGGPRSWNGFIKSLLDPAQLRNKGVQGIEQLKGLLLQRFNMDYMSLDDMKRGLDVEQVEKVAQRLGDARPGRHADLSFNDALMAFAVYALRRTSKESAIYDGFGYRTWWLTKETHIIQMTGELVMREGTPYIMRPEFLLNFITLAPKAAVVREQFRALLPSTVGLQLGKHLSGEAMEELLVGVKEWAALPPERITVMLTDKVNQLKYDRYKRYPQAIG